MIVRRPTVFRQTGPAALASVPMFQTARGARRRRSICRAVGTSLAAAALLTPATTRLWAGGVEREQKKIERSGETALRAQVAFGAGTFDLRAGPEHLILDAEAVYDRRKVSFYTDYTRRRGRGHLELAAELVRKRLDGKITNDWQVALTPGLPLELDLKIGAADARIDCTGLRLTDLELNIGAAKAEVRWDRPNRERLRMLSIDCGASSLTLTGLGNANFEFLDFNGGLGSFELDFSGAWSRPARAEFEVGMGALQLLLPEDIGVRIETEGSFLSALDVDRRFERIAEGLYETPNYRDAAVRFDLRIKLGVGSVDVRTIRR